MSTFLVFVEGTTLKSLEFDAVIQQTHSYQAEVTEHEVEVGANTTDHIRQRAETVRLSCILTDSPMRGAPDASMDGTTSAWLTNAVPLFSAARTISNQQSAVSADPNADNPEAGRWRVMFDRLQKLKNDGTLCTLVTTPKAYKNMVISGIEAPHDATVADALRVTLELRQIRVVQTAVSTVTLLAKTNTGKPKAELGPQTPKTPDAVTATQATQSKSALAAAADWVTGG